MIYIYFMAIGMYLHELVHRQADKLNSYTFFNYIIKCLKHISKQSRSYKSKTFVRIFHTVLILKRKVQVLLKVQLMCNQNLRF